MSQQQYTGSKIFKVARGAVKRKDTIVSLMEKEPLDHGSIVSRESIPVID